MPQYTKHVITDSCAWQDEEGNDVLMAAILDPDGDQICVVPESAADGLLSHLNKD